MTEEGMNAAEAYESAIDHSGRSGAVFEWDGLTAYFYLLEMRETDGFQIAATLNITSLMGNFSPMDVIVKWNASGTAAGLFAADDLLALFDLEAIPISGRIAQAEDPQIFQTR